MSFGSNKDWHSDIVWCIELRRKVDRMPIELISLFLISPIYIYVIMCLLISQAAILMASTSSKVARFRWARIRAWSVRVRPASGWRAPNERVRFCSVRRRNRFGRRANVVRDAPKSGRWRRCRANAYSARASIRTANTLWPTTVRPVARARMERRCAGARHAPCWSANRNCRRWAMIVVCIVRSLRWPSRRARGTAPSIRWESQAKYDCVYTCVSV